MELDKVKDSTCTKCSSLELKNVELNQVIMKYKKCQLVLESVLGIKYIQMIEVVLDIPSLTN